MRTPSAIGIAVALLGMTLALEACGLKADPAFPTKAPAASVATPTTSALRLEKADKSIVLSWPAGKADGLYIINREEKDPACPACREESRRIAQIRRSEPAACAPGEGGQCRYVDKEVKSGVRYYYRVQTCLDQDACSAPTFLGNTVY